jgi:hypothetical protein
LTKNQISRQSMHKSVLVVLEEAVDLTAPVVSIARCYTGLVNLADAIDEANVTQESRNGLAAAKTTAKKQLVDIAHDVASAVVSYGAENEDDDLVGRCSYSPTDLGKGADGTVVSRCKGVHAAATEVVADLGEHGVTPAKLTTLKKKIDGFDKLSTKPRVSVVRSSAATRRLPVLFSQASRLLTKRLDTLMVQFKNTQPEFYARYKSARRLVSAATRPVKDAKAAAGKTPAAKAA